MNLYTDESNRGIYFHETKNGNWTLFRADGTHTTIRKTPEFLEDEPAIIKTDWMRGTLLMEEYGIWDVTAFGCTMSLLIGFMVNDHAESGHCQNDDCSTDGRTVASVTEDESPEMKCQNVAGDEATGHEALNQECQKAAAGTLYLFASCKAAERMIFPRIPKEAAEISRRYVDEFYANPELQKRWEGMILHPVCFKVTPLEDAHDSPEPAHDSRNCAKTFEPAISRMTHAEGAYLGFADSGRAGSSFTYGDMVFEPVPLSAVGDSDAALDHASDYPISSLERLSCQDFFPDCSEN